MKKTVLIVVTLALAMACASVPLKQKAVLSLQGTEVALGQAQDSERQLCDPVKAAVAPPVVISECAGPTASAIGLTTERHRQIASALARAFYVQQKAAIALQAWRAGDPTPAGIIEISSAAQEALAVVRQLTAANDRVEAVVAKLEDAIKKLADLVTMLK